MNPPTRRMEMNPVEILNINSSPPPAFRSSHIARHGRMQYIEQHEAPRIVAAADEEIARQRKVSKLLLIDVGTRCFAESGISTELESL
jgi:hypothetical protein